MSDAARGTGEPFTSARAAALMVAACCVAKLDSRGAQMIRLGENALFRLGVHPVIVRIARTPDYLSSAQIELEVSRWLEREGFPAARVVDDLEQPQVIDGHPVTFWHLIKEASREATYGELGAVLRDLHSMRLPEGLLLPPTTPSVGRSCASRQRRAFQRMTGSS